MAGAVLLIQIDALLAGDVISRWQAAHRYANSHRRNPRYTNEVCSNYIRELHASVDE
jgi:hypothetical protein